MPGTPDATTLLAFDYGGRRIGIAVGQSVTGSASPLGTVANRDGGPDWPAVERLLAEWRPSLLVVGLPLAEDGAESDISAAARRFAAELARFGLPVEVIDERYSSLEARERLVAERRQGLRGRLSRDMVDAAAAVVIAERWLDRAGARRKENAQ